MTDRIADLFVELPFFQKTGPRVLMQHLQEFAEDFLGKISQFSEGVESWAISDSANGADVVRAQWSTVGPAGPWNDIASYDTDFAIDTNVARGDSITLWFRLMTPTSTSSFNQYSSTMTVTAQEY